jgi:hypothetical protein
METFGQWFKRRGWKSYTIPAIVSLVINYGIFFSDGGLTTMLQDPDIPIVIWVIAGIAYFGFHIGMAWHIMDAYKKQRQ